MRSVARVGVVMFLVCCALGVSPAAAQSPAPQPGPMMPAPPLPPATMMEGFRQPIGSLLTSGYDELGDVAGVSVEVRQMSDTHGGRVRGLVVEVASGQTARELSFVDADEIPELLKGFDALLAITANPTEFRSFEVRYATRGELELSASSSRNRGILYAVAVGRLTKARRGGLTAGDMHQLRTLFEAASQKLATLAADK